MEVKKSKKADLESKHTQRFMLSLAIVTVCFLAIMEYSTTEEVESNTGEDVELIHSDPELVPMSLPEEMSDFIAHTEESTSDVLEIVPDGTELDQPEQTNRQDKSKSGGDVIEEETDDKESDALKPLTTDSLTFRVVEELPQFPGGAVAFMKWLTKNLSYPQAAADKKIEGKVVAEFIVNEDGSVSNLKLVKTINPLCDNEALRVLRMMPQWKAGVQNGKPCRTKVAIPIVFAL